VVALMLLEEICYCDKSEEDVLAFVTVRGGEVSDLRVLLVVLLLLLVLFV
jgi:hypothetical protein